MRYTWPSWVGILLGVLFVGFGLWHRSMGDGTFGAGLVVAGAILIAAGLHAIQSAWSSCGGCYGWDDCDCGHCEGCKGGDCCGQCDCMGPQGSGGGHEGHAHDGGHSH